ITVNMNLIPFDPAPASVTSGVRIGTAAVTTRGLGNAEMVQIADFIARVAENLGNTEIYDAVRAEVNALAARFPMPQIIC
ncbi:MAG: serine hydroxymethyltransferase, partial [Victivallales bacterium]|nr:serine hydroxymethyltransferase [Victivallales bacterium]